MHPQPDARYNIVNAPDTLNGGRSSWISAISSSSAARSLSHERTRNPLAAATRSRIFRWAFFRLALLYWRRRLRKFAALPT